MIERLHLLRNIGQFDSVVAANIPLKHYTLIYAENGRGKTTLTAILRSLSTGDPLHISERRRLASANPPHVVVECSGGPPNPSFRDGAWNRTLADLVIFDDRFVDENVYSGLSVDADHRQNLHELILGAQGVALSRDLQEAVDQIARDNAAIRAAGEAVPIPDRYGLPVDEFCALPPVADADQAIANAEQALRSARQATAIQQAGLFLEIRLPTIDPAKISALLGRSWSALDESAIERVHSHCRALGERGEEWVSIGMEMLPDEEADPTCPFCEQPLSSSPRIDDFRAYFSDEYAQLKNAISETVSEIEQAHGGDSPAAFERSVRAAQDSQRFWSAFTDIEPIGIDAAQITRNRIAARDAVLQVLTAKRGAPLESLELPADTLHSIEALNADAFAVDQLSHRLASANQTIREVKRAAVAADAQAIERGLNRLKATKARQLAPTSQLCDSYEAAQSAKKCTEERRERAKAALRQYRTTVFPQFQRAVNEYLRLFGAGFRIGQVTARDIASGPTCTFGVVINNTTVPVAGGTPRPGEPSFRNTLSSGDRNTLALSFYFASLDQDPALATRIAVIDDPLSSLDDHRSLTTLQQIRSLGERVEQVVVLSHSKSFLCELYGLIDQTLCSALSIVRDVDGSTVAQWDANSDRLTQHDVRHAMLVRYFTRGPGGVDSREIARSIRPHLEAFLRVACPEAFPPGTLLGQFRNVCEQRVGQPNEILGPHYISELRDLTEYSNRYHHDTNPAWATENVNDALLQSYIGRLLAFVRR